MASTVVSDPVVVDPVINPPGVAKFTVQIDVPPPLTPPLPLPSTPYVAPPISPPLPSEPLKLIALLPYPSNLVADKDDDVVVEFHQKKWK